MRRRVEMHAAASLVALTACVLFTFVGCGDDPVGPKTEPILTTDGARAATDTTAECGGTVVSDGGEAVTVRGFCWSTNPMPTVADNTTTNGTGTGYYQEFITDLTVNTTYYVRAYATNSVGTGYGNEKWFRTSIAVTDIDGNVYQTVTIGTQVWMAENLKVTRYRNGENIPIVAESVIVDDSVIDGAVIWSGLTTGAYCEYNNDAGNVPTYGRLYNWYAVNDSRNIAPAGWHVPTEAEWQTLVDYLGGYAVAGGKMKESGTVHWAGPNTGATNESEFFALPAGFRYLYGAYNNMGKYTYFWSSTERSDNDALFRSLNFNDSGIYGNNFFNKRYGFSIRCVRD